MEKNMKKSVCVCVCVCVYKIYIYKVYILYGFPWWLRWLYI